MTDNRLTAQLSALEGDWQWHCVETDHAQVRHKLTILGGMVLEEGLPCRVALLSDEMRIRLSDETAELRFTPLEGQSDHQDAELWVLPDGLDDAAHLAMPIDANDNGMEMLARAELVRVG